MSPFCQETAEDQGGGSADEEMEGQWGVPERLWRGRSVRCAYAHEEEKAWGLWGCTYEMEVTAQPRWTAARQMRLPGGRVSEWGFGGGDVRLGG